MRDIGGTLGNAIEPQGLRDLRARMQNPSEADLSEVARQFEAVFVEMMVKQMRSATPGETLFGGNAEETYRGLYDRQMALQLSRGEGVGLAPMIERQLRENAGYETASIHHAPRDLSDYRRAAPAVALQQEAAARVGKVDGASADAYAPPHVSKVAASGEPLSVGLGGKGPAWSNPREFVAAIAPAAQKTAQRLGVPAVALVAQAALETGWGRHVIQDGSGRSSNNLFNIKAHTPGWDGGSVRVPTLEYRGGVPQRELADFRAYSSVEESFNDYAEFLQRNPRYRQALQAGEDPVAYVRALQEAGYATDPQYADKLQRIMQLDEGHSVRAGADILKIPGDVPKG